MLYSRGCDICRPMLVRGSGLMKSCANVTAVSYLIVLVILGRWGGAKTKMKTKNKPSILELTASIFLCLDLPDFVPWGGVFLFCFPETQSCAWLRRVSGECQCPHAGVTIVRGIVDPSHHRNLEWNALRRKMKGLFGEGLWRSTYKRECRA